MTRAFCLQRRWAAVGTRPESTFRQVWVVHSERKKSDYLVVKKRKLPPQIGFADRLKSQHSQKIAVQAGKLTSREFTEKPFRSRNCEHVQAPP